MWEGSDVRNLGVLIPTLQEHTGGGGNPERHVALRTEDKQRVRCSLGLALTMAYELAHTAVFKFFCVATNKEARIKAP